MAELQRQQVNQQNRTIQNPQPQPYQTRQTPVQDPIEDGENITFCPELGGASETIWREIHFRANVPVFVKDKDLIDAARGNRFFQVGNEKKALSNETPKTHDQYRAHVIRWLGETKNTEDLIKRWAADRELRTSCEAGSDDYRYLSQFLETKLRDHARFDGLDDQKVASLFLKHGIVEIPWR